MSPLLPRPVLLLATALILSTSSAASVDTNTTGPPPLIQDFTVPSDYRTVPADIPPSCTRASSSCGSEADGVSACRVYTPATSSCTRFCWGVIQRFPLLKRGCRRRGRRYWWQLYRTYGFCLSECKQARSAIRLAGGRPRALVRVTYRNGRFSGAHMLFSPTRRVLKNGLPSLCKTNPSCSAPRAKRGECSRRICRPRRPRILAGKEGPQACWYCYWSNTRCPRRCGFCKPWKFCWKRRCRC